MAQLPLDPALAACCAGCLAEMCALAGCLSAEGSVSFQSVSAVPCCATCA